MLTQTDRNVDIALLQPPGWAIQNPPLGLAMLKSYLAQNGLHAKAFDLNILLYNLKHGPYSNAWELSNGYYSWERESYVQQMFDYYSHEILSFIYHTLSFNPKVIGISTHCSTMLSAKLLARKCKQLSPDTKIILGGPQVSQYTHHWKDFLECDYIDAIVFGEGEESLTEYLQSLNSEKLPCPIKGVAYKDNKGKVLNGGTRDLIPSLDSLPFPDFSDFDLKYYAGTNVLPTYFSRGCINKCIYCTENKFFPRFRNRSGKRVYEEIVHQKSLYPETQFFRMHDSLSNGNIKELETLCDLLLENNTGIGFNLENAVVRKEMDSKLYRKLKAAGCVLIGYGLENPSKPLLKSVGKRACLDADFDNVIAEGARENIQMGVNMMFGLPGETPADFDQQISFLKKHRKYRKHITINPALNFCYFPEGSEVNSNPEAYGVDMSLGELYWSSKDGENTFLDRLAKFEKFCSFANSMGYGNLFNITNTINKHELLGNYYYKKKEYVPALEHLNRSFDTEIKTLELAEHILRIYDESGLEKDKIYDKLSQYKLRYNTNTNSKLDDIRTASELTDYVSSFSITDATKRLHSYIVESQPPALELSFGGLKRYLKYIRAALFSKPRTDHFVILELFKDIDNKITALKKKSE